VAAGAGNYSVDSRFKLITADAGRSGTFTTLTTNLAFLNPYLEYDPNNVWLVFARNDINLCDVAGTANQSESCKGIDSLDDNNPIKDDIIHQDEEHARDAYDQLSGEIHATVKTAMLQDSRFPREAALDRMGISACQLDNATNRADQYDDGDERRRIREQMGCGGDNQRPVAWGRIFGSWGHQDGDGNAARVERGIGGVFVGDDQQISDSWRVGVLGGYSSSNLNVSDRHSHADISSWHLGLHAGGQWDNLGLRVGVSEAWNSLKTKRNVNFPGFSDTLTANYHATTSQAFAELGYRIERDTRVFEPFANVAWVTLKTDAFTEKGGAAALTAPGQSSHAMLSTLGLRWSDNFDKDMGRSYLSVGWQHATAKTPTATLQYASGSDAYSVAGIPLARNVVSVEAGLDFSTSETSTLNLSYNGQFGSGVTDNGLRATYRTRF
jgi:outer membrane autotransporter protein